MHGYQEVSDSRLADTAADGGDYAIPRLCLTNAEHRQPDWGHEPRLHHTSEPRKATEDLKQPIPQAGRAWRHKRLSREVVARRRQLPRLQGKSQPCQLLLLPLAERSRQQPKQLEHPALLNQRDR